MSNKITKEENSFYKSYPVYKIAFKTEGRVREQYQVSICQNGRTLRVRWGGGGGRHGGVFHIPLPTLFKVCLTVF